MAHGQCIVAAACGTTTRLESTYPFAHGREGVQPAHEAVRVVIAGLRNGSLGTQVLISRQGRRARIDVRADAAEQGQYRVLRLGCHVQKGFSPP